MTEPVTRALIPCGGRGTRMQALTHGAPKELIPIAGRPALIWVLEECAASGIDEVLIVLSPQKHTIAGLATPLAGLPGMPRRIRFLTQPEPRGLADAIWLGRHFAANAPLAVALPDNLFVGPRPALLEVAQSFAATNCSTVAVVSITAGEAARRGPTAVWAGSTDGDVFHIQSIPSKSDRLVSFDTGGKSDALTGVGRYVFSDAVWPAIEAVARDLPVAAELDDVPVMQYLLARGQLLGRRLQARFLDVGWPSGVGEADALLAKPLDHAQGQHPRLPT
jgi:UTP--glucose-1-phosphate uridylyltransferase